ncbi:MAG: MBL fold metallo-hydrolase [Polyangiaceae bacterium]
MQITSIEGNTQRLDGGAMFGNAPRALWAKWAPPDEQNRILLACRAMLVREEGRNMLLEAGIGAFFAPKMRERFGVVESEHVLLKSLAAEGIAPEKIDVVILSHLHFDHAGGLLTAYREGASLDLVFPNARYVVGACAWDRAQHPHVRDRASFIPELVPLLEKTGRIELVPEDATTIASLGDRFTFTHSEGHTPGLLLTTVNHPRGPITFCADLIPGRAWVHAPITMGYDRFPERLIEEKTALLERVVSEKGYLFYTHDPEVAASRVQKVESGKFVAIESDTRVTWP